MSRATSGFLAGLVSGGLGTYLKMKDVERADAKEKRDQESLHRGVLVVAVILIGPAAGQGESADKTDYVEDAPGVEPGDQGNAEVENDEVGEQRHHRVAAR